jgi:2-polyprenyl-3-methyl-5-hydroxy-6-metoxy-1,4-benzoquinol methylase
MWDSHVISHIIRFLDHNIYFRPNKLNIKSILDLGAGEGWLSIWLRYLMDEQPSNRNTWKTEINAIELYTPYNASLMRQFYSNVYLQDLFEVNISNYDLIIGLEVLEHIDRSKAKVLIRQLQNDNKYFLFSTPKGFREAPLHHGNPHQEHVSGWTNQDFHDLGLKTKIIDGLYLFAFSSEFEWDLQLHKKIRRKVVPERIRKKIRRIV